MAGAEALMVGAQEEGAVHDSEEQAQPAGNPMKDVLDIPWANRPDFLLDLVAVSLLGATMGLLSVPYSWITEEPASWWFEKTGPEGFLKKPETMQFCSGSLLWIPLCLAGGTAVGILKVMLRLDAFPSFITELKHIHVDPVISAKVLVCCIASLIVGATLGLEAGLGATGSALGYLWALGVNKVYPGARANPEAADLRRRTFILCGICAAFGSILPAPYVAALLVGELSAAGTERHAPATEFMAGRKLPKKVLIFLVPASTFAFVARWALQPEPMVSTPGYLKPYDNLSAFYGLGLGLFAAFVGLTFLIIQGICKMLTTKVGNMIERCCGKSMRIIMLASWAGLVTGIGMYVTPLVYSSGRSTMDPTINHAAALSTPLLIGTALMKSVTFSFAISCGLVGGLFFPVMYVGLLGGLIAHRLFNLNGGLAVTVMIAAVPGSFVTAPLTMMSLPVSMFVMGPLHTVAVFIGVVTSNTLLVGTGLVQRILKI